MMETAAHGHGRGQLVSRTRQASGSFTLGPSGLSFTSDDGDVWSVPAAPAAEWLIRGGAVVVHFNGVATSEWRAPSLVIDSDEHDSWKFFLSGLGVRPLQTYGSIAAESSSSWLGRSARVGTGALVGVFAVLMWVFVIVEGIAWVAVIVVSLQGGDVLTAGVTFIFPPAVLVTGFSLGNDVGAAVLACGVAGMICAAIASSGERLRA